MKTVTINCPEILGDKVFYDCDPNFTVKTAGVIKYTVPQNGIYKITLYGARGTEMTSTSGDKWAGKKGATVEGFIRLNKGDTLTTEKYLGGNGITNQSPKGSSVTSGNGRNRFWYKAK